MSKYKEEHNKKLSIKAEKIIEKLPEICQEYFTGHSSISDNTKLSYATQLTIFLSYLVEKGFVTAGCVQEVTLKELAELPPQKIEKFVGYIEKEANERKKNSDLTINHYLATLGSFYKYICSHHRINFNPMSVVEHRKLPDQDVVYLSDKERARFLSSAETVKPLKSGKLSDKKIRDSIRNTAIIKLFLSTGIRVSELVGLDIKDINFEEHCLTVDRKGGKKDHDVFFSDDAEAALKEYLQIREEFIPKKKEKGTVSGPIEDKKKEKPETALFLSGRGGKRMTVRGIEEMISKYREMTNVGGKKITPHKLRSSFAVHRLEANGGDLKDVQDALSHKRISSTLRYVDKTGREKRRKNRNL